MLTVKDGTLLREEDLPEYDKSVFSGLEFNFDGHCEEITGFVPIYEDVDVILEEKAERE